MYKVLLVGHGIDWILDGNKLEDVECPECHVKYGYWDQFESAFKFTIESSPKHGRILFTCRKCRCKFAIKRNSR